MSHGSDKQGWGGLLEDEIPPEQATGRVPAPPRKPGLPRPQREPAILEGRNIRPEPPRNLRGHPSASRGPENTRGLSLPIPDPAPERTGTGPGPDRPGAPLPLTGAIFERLGAPDPDPTSAPPRPEPAPHASAETLKSGWVEYREVVLSVVVGIAGIAAAMVYTGRTPSDSEPEAARVNQEATRVDEPPNAGARSPPIRDEPKGAAQPTTDPRHKTRTPMLSVLTSPPGALVDIGGIIYGKTPLVIPSPDPESLSITLKLGGFLTWRKTVLPEESGHFSIHVKLSKP